jgi:hypothetical protein
LLNLAKDKQWKSLLQKLQLYNQIIEGEWENIKLKSNWYRSPQLWKLLQYIVSDKYSKLNATNIETILKKGITGYPWIDAYIVSLWKKEK